VAGQTGYTQGPLITINFADGPRAGNPFVIARVMNPCVPTMASLWGYNVINPVLLTQSPTFVTLLIPGTPTNRCYITIQYVSFA
jgi:hypothetical protein